MSSARDSVVELTRVQRKRDVALGYRLFAKMRWGDVGDGHISARDPEHEDCFWVLGGDVPFSRATVNDLVLVAPDGSLRVGEGGINRAGYYIHHPVHEARPDIVSAAHTHTGWGTPFSAECRPILPITQESCIFFNDTAMFDDEEVQIQDCDGGRRIAAALGDKGAIILRNHGILTAAASVAETVGRFVMLERVCEAHLKARDAQPISEEAALYAQKDLVKDGVGKQAFEWLVNNHLHGVSVD
ncbi:MAG: class II aldolase/adducin family protein [Pseudomonadota bacterium]